MKKQTIEVPTHFINIMPHLQKHLGKLPEPPLHPATHQSVQAADLKPIFPMALIEQEMSLQEKIEIPQPVREIYQMYRPTPLLRARRLEQLLGTPAHIYYKYEGATLTGSHKLNTAVAQAYYNQQEGIQKLVTETGAGQWGTALSLACQLFDLKCQVFMVNVSFTQKPYRKHLMHIYGAEVLASPSSVTEFGRRTRQERSNHPGSLGIAISEALEIAAQDPTANYALGSVLNHVILHQTVIGQEVQQQMEVLGEYPDTIIGCVGGGSNFAGFAIPFLIDKLNGKKPQLRAIGVEASACPKMTKGEYRYDSGDTAGMTPLLKMQTLGHDFVPPGVHAGGLRYHGNSPLLSFLNEEKITEARAYEQSEIFEAAVAFARTEGVVIAPESAHALKAAIDEALLAKEKGEEKVILFNCSGHGLLDLQGYADYLADELSED